jgi:transcriptional regulator with XRE-family HTH domain
MSDEEIKNLDQKSSYISDIEIKNLEQEAKYISDRVCLQLGSYFNYYRETVRCYSLRELSKISGISIALISAFEDGKKLPRIETLIKLMLALNIQFDEIFGLRLKSVNHEIRNRRSPIMIQDNPLHEFLLKIGYGKNEVKDIIKYTDFIRFKRGCAYDFYRMP